LRACAMAQISRSRVRLALDSTCVGRYFNFAYGKHCGRFLAERHGATASWRERWASPMLHGPWQGRAPRTAWR